MEPENNDSGFSSDDDDDVAAQEAAMASIRITGDWRVTDSLTGTHHNATMN